ncbi:MAG TPA: alpha/beta fold hydrolase [Gammaproteobacteria bacterium]|nr:alpha/beta fold hydrolase [Gammaproteobacteria bacterium]
MTLVLIPGLDGTGEFFKPFLDIYGRDRAEVISLPQAGPQDYAALTEYVAQQLPVNRDYVLLAESFGGPIGANLALRGLPRLKGVVFVATFLSPPAWWATTLGLMLPLKKTVPTRLGRMILRWLLAGSLASDRTMDWVQQVVGGVPADIIKARIRAIRRLRPQQGRTDVPALYIQSTQDSLIAAAKFRQFGAHFSDLKLFKIEGPHLILPSRPGDCARTIRRLFPTLQG